jgi:hypothetical protein
MDVIARRVNWMAIVASGLLFISPLLPTISWITEEPLNTLLLLLLCAVMPALPFVTLLLHLRLRSKLDKKPSDAVSESVIVTCVVMFVISVIIFFKGVLPEEYGVILVFFMPFLTIPATALVCLLSWKIATFIITRKEKHTEPSVACDAETRAHEP